MEEDLDVILLTQELFCEVTKITEKLPASRRQSLGARLENSVLLLLELLISAKYAPKSHKAPFLIRANAASEIIRFYLRILLKQNLANATTLHQLLARNLEIGRQIGGWRRSAQ